MTTPIYNTSKKGQISHPGYPNNTGHDQQKKGMCNDTKNKYIKTSKIKKKYKKIAMVQKWCRNCSRKYFRSETKHTQKTHK